MSSSNSSSVSSHPTTTANSTLQDHSNSKGAVELRETPIDLDSTQQLTQYHGASDTVEVTEEFTPPNDLWRGTNSLPDQGMREILSRSYRVGTLTWSSTDGLATQLLPPDDMIATLLSIPQIAERLRFFRYFRCRGVRVELRTMSTITHQGFLALSKTFNNSYAFHNIASDGAQFCNNRSVIVSATSAQTVHDEVYWRSNRQFYDISTGQPSHIMTYQITVAVPLKQGTVDGNISDVALGLYYQFIDPELTMPIYDQGAPFLSTKRSVAQSGMGFSEARKKSQNSVQAPVQSSVPGTVFSVLDSANRLASRIAPIAELCADKPTTLRHIEKVAVMPGSDLPSTKGLDIGVRMAADPEARTGLSTSSAGDDQGDFSLYQLVRTPSIYDTTITYSDTYAVGQLFGHIDLNPTLLCQVDFGAGPSATITHSPVSWYAPMFRFWRGSIDIALAWTTPATMQSQFRICWFPPGQDAPATLAAIDTGDVISQVIEVSGPGVHKFRVPWISPTLYRKTMGGNTWLDMVNTYYNHPDYSLGTVAFYVETALVPLDYMVSPSVDFLVFVAAGPDFQFSNFAGEESIADAQTLDVLGTVSTAVSGFVPTKRVLPLSKRQSMHPKVLKSSKSKKREFVPKRSVAQVGSDPSQQTSTFVVNELFAGEVDSIIPATFSLERGHATSEFYASIVELGKRYYIRPLSPEAASSHSYISTFRWDQFQLAAGNTTTMTLHQRLTAPFVNFRGSSRFQVFWDVSHASADVNPRVRGAFIDPVAGTTDLLLCNPDFVTANAGSNNFLAFTIPWSTWLPFVNRAETADGLEVKAILPATDASTLTDVGLIGYSFGDDFQVGIFQAVPVVLISTP